MNIVPVTRALISVSDKSGIIQFARRLAEKGIEILSTGGTSKVLKENNVPVISVDSYTGHPEIMDGRVKTLHPRIHGGILAIRDNPTHREQMVQNGIKPIDLVVVNLYPFQKTISNPEVRIEEAIENIDIGGPTMVRSSAKNHAYVTIVVDPADYEIILAEIDSSGGISFETRKRMAVKAFRHTADYDAAIDKYLSKVYLNEEILRLSYSDGEELRYGENPHQKAVFFKNIAYDETSVSRGAQLHGKELSYNNIVDGDAALEVIKEIADFAAVAVIKHNNPCGFATGSDLTQALEAAWAGDPVSAYGSIIAVSRQMDLKTAQALSGRFVEMVIAPDFTPEAIDFLKTKSSSIRLLAVGELGNGTVETQSLKHVTGGLLWQTRDLGVSQKWESVTKIPFPTKKKDLANFALVASKHVKSNAIVLAQEYAAGFFNLLGMGAGQPNRVDSFKKLALCRAVENLKTQYQNAKKELPKNGLFPELAEVVLASDAFFPFSDIVEEAHACGIRYIVQPGGAKRDAEIIETCDRLGMSMVFTGMRHFRH